MMSLFPLPQQREGFSEEDFRSNPRLSQGRDVCIAALKALSRDPAAPLEVIQELQDRFGALGITDSMHAEQAPTFALTTPEILIECHGSDLLKLCKKRLGLLHDENPQAYTGTQMFLEVWGQHLAALSELMSTSKVVQQPLPNFSVLDAKEISSECSSVFSELYIRSLSSDSWKVRIFKQGFTGTLGILAVPINDGVIFTLLESYFCGGRAMLDEHYMKKVRQIVAQRGAPFASKSDDVITSESGYVRRYQHNDDFLRLISTGGNTMSIDSPKGYGEQCCHLQDLQFYGEQILAVARRELDLKSFGARDFFSPY